MTRFFKVLAVLIGLAVGFSNAAAQVTTPSPSQQDRVFQGTLIEIDTAAKTLTAKAGDNTEMMFRYTDSTEIIGSDSSAQALTSKAGSGLNVTYNVNKGGNIATRIEFVPMWNN
jgi:hypothetical protein